MILEYILNKCSYIIGHFNAHFLLYVFFAKELLAVYFIFTMEMMLDKKQNLSDFLI